MHYVEKLSILISVFVLFLSFCFLYSQLDDDQNQHLPKPKTQTDFGMVIFLCGWGFIFHPILVLIVHQDDGNLLQEQIRQYRGRDGILDDRAWKKFVLLKIVDLVLNTFLFILAMYLQHTHKSLGVYFWSVGAAIVGSVVVSLIWNGYFNFGNLDFTTTMLCPLLVIETGDSSKDAVIRFISWFLIFFYLADKGGWGPTLKKWYEKCCKVLSGSPSGSVRYIFF